MFRRVEACFPLENPKLRDQVIQDLELYLTDNTQAWGLESDGDYRRLQPGDGEAAITAQVELLKSLAEKA